MNHVDEATTNSVLSHILSHIAQVLLLKTYFVFKSVTISKKKKKKYVKSVKSLTTVANTYL